MILPHTEVWHCTSSSCDLQFAWPQLDDEHLSQAYQRLYYPGNSLEAIREPLAATTDVVLRQLFESVKNQHPNLAGRRLLDYGCGSAVLATVAREYGMVTTGIESDPNARSEACAAQICPVYADVGELLAASPNAQFDCIVLWNVVEHLRYPWLEMRKLREVCAPGAFLIAATPNANCVRARLMGARWEERVNLTHLYYFTRTSLAATFRLAGFSDMVSNHKFVAYPHHGPLRRLAQRMLVACRLDGKLEFWARPNDSLSSMPAAPRSLAKVC